MAGDDDDASIDETEAGANVAGDEPQSMRFR